MIPDVTKTLQIMRTVDKMKIDIMKQRGTMEYVTKAWESKVTNIGRKKTYRNV